MKGRRLSDDFAELVYRYADDGDPTTGQPLSVRSIARLLHKDHSTIRGILRRRQDGTLHKRDFQRGRPRKTTRRQDERLLLAVKRNRHVSLVEHTRTLAFPVSRWTIRRRLLEKKVRVHVALQDVLNQVQKRNRVQWCRRYIDYDFSNVIFSDECIFQLRRARTCGQVRVYRRRGERLKAASIFSVPYVERQGTLCIWGCLSASGFGCLRILSGTMNSEKYCDTLESYLLPSVDILCPDNSFVFMQDNATIHTANRTTEWLAEHEIEVLPWPPYSPDLNPMENVWGLLKRQLKTKLPTSPESLADNISELWNSYTNDYAAHLCDSLRRRIRRVVQRNGLRL